MIVRHPGRRRAALVAARIGAAGSAVMLAVTGWAALSPDVGPASAAANAGVVQVVTPFDGSPGAGQPLTTGGSHTAFTLDLPTGAACTGDSAGAGYRVQSYMVPESVDPATLQFGANGPTPPATGAAFRQPLWSTAQSPFVDQQTANADTPDGPGFVINLPAFDFTVYDQPGLIPAGTYNIGVACTLGGPSPTQVDRFWNGKLAVAPDANDAPAGIAWTVVAVAPPPTTTTSTTSTTSTTAPTTSTSTSTSTTSTTSTSTTSTTRRATTTTTTSTTSTTDPDDLLDEAATTTEDPGATTTTIDPGETTTTAFGAEVLGVTETPSGGSSGGGDPTSPVVSGGTLPRTGSSTAALLVWAALLLLFGRMTVLLARTPAVVVVRRG